MIEDGNHGLSILDRLARGDLLISDGAAGTYLQGHGLEPGACPEEFNFSHPEVVQGMARAYFEAGSALVLTNTFGANRFMLEKHGHGDRAGEFNRLGAQLARSQAPLGGYVFGSVGPSGQFLEPLGDVSEAEMLDAFVEQVTALEEGGVDGVVVETMTAVEEAALAIKAARESTGLVVASTMVFDKSPRGFFTMMGVTPDRAVKTAFEEGAHIAGANCGNGIEVMAELARELRQITGDGYLLVHSNAGIPVLKDGEVMYPETPEFMAEHFKVLAGLGINIIGGCCGTGPAHIRALAAALRG
jgi:5-methyltetrahydrofolate--homocysteine methyltransferase